MNFLPVVIESLKPATTTPEYCTRSMTHAGMMLHSLHLYWDYRVGKVLPVTLPTGRLRALE
jgi:hypothetical protein